MNVNTSMRKRISVTESFAPNRNRHHRWQGRILKRGWKQDTLQGETVFYLDTRRVRRARRRLARLDQTPRRNETYLNSYFLDEQIYGDSLTNGIEFAVHALRAFPHDVPIAATIDRNIEPINGRHYATVVQFNTAPDSVWDENPDRDLDVGRNGEPSKNYALTITREDALATQVTRLRRHDRVKVAALLGPHAIR